MRTRIREIYAGPLGQRIISIRYSRNRKALAGLERELDKLRARPWPHNVRIDDIPEDEDDEDSELDGIFVPFGFDDGYPDLRLRNDIETAYVTASRASLITDMLGHFFAKGDDFSAAMLSFMRMFFEAGRQEKERARKSLEPVRLLLVEASCSIPYQLIRDLGFKDVESVHAAAIRSCSNVLRSCASLDAEHSVYHDCRDDAERWEYATERCARLPELDTQAVFSAMRKEAVIANKSAGGRDVELNPTEEAIVEALGKKGHRLTTEPLLQRALGKVNSHGKGVLSSLCKRGILNNREDEFGKGYGLPIWSGP